MCIRDRHDASGRWFFQNGPQRVFVALDYAPWTLALDGNAQMRTHTGERVETVHGAWVDDEFNLLLDTEFGIGLVNDRDLAPLTEMIENEAGTLLTDSELEGLFDTLGGGDAPPAFLRWAGQRVPIGYVARADVPERFRFDPAPTEENAA